MTKILDPPSEEQKVQTKLRLIRPTGSNCARLCAIFEKKNTHTDAQTLGTVKCDGRIVSVDVFHLRVNPLGGLNQSI